MCEENRELDEENLKFSKQCSSGSLQCSAKKNKFKKRKSPKMISCIP